MGFWKLYFSFNGRVGRRAYWLCFILPIVTIGYIATAIIDQLIGADKVIVYTYQLIIAWPALAVQAKRWHDLNKSGWWILVNLIPIVGSLWALIVNGFYKGTDGDNRFGSDPVKV